jgi:hypothetical protein
VLIVWRYSTGRRPPEMRGLLAKRDGRRRAGGCVESGRGEPWWVVVEVVRT